MNARPRLRELIDSPEALTQYGSRAHLTETGRPFRNRPRPTDSDGLSLQRGAVPPLRIREQAFGSTPRDGDGVRLSTVTLLQQAGFTVEETPRRMNPAHVSVQFPGEWTDEVAEAFDRCFTDGLFVDTSAREGE